jgi:hypothetical protein
MESLSWAPLILYLLDVSAERWRDLAEAGNSAIFMGNRFIAAGAAGLHL